MVTYQSVITISDNARVSSAMHCKERLIGMGKFVDLTNKVVGNMIVISKNEEESNKIRSGGKRRIHWNCKCKCGKEVVIPSNRLNCKNPQKYCSPNCGCMEYDKRLHLEEQRFGRWTVIREVERPQHLQDDGVNKSYWLCQCDCGNVGIVRGNMLTSGHSTSCGCYNKDLKRKIGTEEGYKRLPHKCGKEHYNYNPTLTDEERILNRDTNENRIWKQQIKEQANFTCNICGEVGGKLRSHHLDGYNWCEERRLDLTNGVCLCESCHKEFHHIYGYGNNTEAQYIEFKKNKIELN